ncbi:hypothetical protein SB749_15065 [Brevibacterium sp. SIMBA_078]|uniref:hypothetical protein n=1 Tax=Brevibacterium sp. SIMBA_078 TaxID=3085816 RepID=UPI00397B1FC7
MPAPRRTSKPRRPKPVNYGTQHAVRLGVRHEEAVAAMQRALAKSRGVDASKISFSESLRLLLDENEKTARIMSGEPESWSPSQTVAVPLEVWNGLTECRNRLSHSQGSLYTIMRRINFGEGIGRDEVRAAFGAVQESKAAVARMEAALVSFLDGKSAGAAAKADDEAA